MSWVIITADMAKRADTKIGKILLSLPEATIDNIKKYSVYQVKGDYEKAERTERFIDELYNEYLYDQNIGLVELHSATNVIHSFMMRLYREKYPRQYRRSILDSDNSRWQRAYRAWRRKVFERDSYVCQDCGTNKKLHAHHVKPRSEYPKLEFDVDNGITLCKRCHSNRHPDNGLLRTAPALTGGEEE